MAKSPAFQLYVQDFILGTMHFTAEQTGAYIRLLCHQWDKFFIEKNEKFIKKITGISKKALPQVLEKFVENEDGNLYNVKLELVRETQIANSLKNSKNGLKGGRPKSQTITENKANDNPKESSSSSSSTSNKKVLKKITSFKDLTEEQFQQAINCYKHDFNPELLRAFFNYWSEKTPAGKMKFQLQKTWELPKRLDTWYQRGLEKGEMFQTPIDQNGKLKISKREQSDQNILNEVE